MKSTEKHSFFAKVCQALFYDLPCKIGFHDWQPIDGCGPGSTVYCARCGKGGFETDFGVSSN